MEFNKITVSDIYEYPITISDVDVKNNTGYDLHADLEGPAARKDMIVREFLNAVHSTVYGVIYNTGEKWLKDKILNHLKPHLEKNIKQALIAQCVYVIENGDLSTWSGVTLNAGGAADVKDTASLISKKICPRALDALTSTNPDITFGGMDL